VKPRLADIKFLGWLKAWKVFPRGHFDQANPAPRARRSHLARGRDPCAQQLHLEPLPRTRAVLSMRPDTARPRYPLLSCEQESRRSRHRALVPAGPSEAASFPSALQGKVLTRSLDGQQLRIGELGAPVLATGSAPRRSGARAPRWAGRCARSGLPGRCSPQMDRPIPSRAGSSPRFGRFRCGRRRAPRLARLPSTTRLPARSRSPRSVRDRSG
jgi:hypothetical protein